MRRRSARWPNGSTRQWRYLRERVLERDGHRCTALVDGKRCTATSETHDLEVHHLNEGGEQIVPDEELTTRCRPCHEATFVVEDVEDVEDEEVAAA